MTGCYAKGCRNSSSYGLKMNFFPRDPDRRSQWIENCKKYGAITYRLPSDGSALCEFHFEPNMWEKIRVDGTKKLKCSAVPTIFGDKIPQVWKTVVEYSEQMKKAKTALGPSNTNNPSGVQMVALPMAGNQFKILLPVSQSVPGKMDNFQIHAIRDVTSTNESSSTVAVNAVLSKNNGVAQLIGSSPPTVTFQNGTQTVEQSTVDITGDEQLIEEEAEEEDSDADSFIANNFEPVSDEEMDVDDNFEPVSEELIGSNEKDDVQVKEVVQVDEIFITNPITAAEIELQSLQAELLSTPYNTDKRCSRCEKTEKVYKKSERLRIMMKKRYKQKQREIRKTIEYLEAKISALEGSQHSLSKLFDREQMSYLLGEKKKVPKWSESTLEKAYQCLLACGAKGYKFLLDQHYPLPCLKTLYKNKNKFPIPHKNTIEFDLSML